MTQQRLLAWSPKSAALVPLLPLGVQGGQTAIYYYQSDPDMLAGVPVPGEDQAAYFTKIDALIGERFEHPDFAFPTEKLVSPRDKNTPVAFAMRRQPGKPLEELLYKAEREALGLQWGRPEWLAVCRQLAKLFAYSEHRGFNQNDPHAGQYLVSWLGRNGPPLRVTRVDTLSSSFWHKGRYHGVEKTDWAYVPSELQRLSRQQNGLKGFQMPREADRFGLACLLFEILTGGKHCDFVGGDPEPARRVEKREFAVISMPPGARVPDEVETAYFELPAEVTTLFERAFLGDPMKRPSPAEWLKGLKALTPPKPVRTWFLPTITFPLHARQAAGRLGTATKRHALVLAGVAAMTGALSLLPPRGQVTTPGGPAVKVPANVVAGTSDPRLPVADDDLPALPPMTRRLKNPDADRILNAK